MDTFDIKTSRTVDQLDTLRDTIREKSEESCRKIGEIIEVVMAEMNQGREK